MVSCGKEKIVSRVEQGEGRGRYFGTCRLREESRRRRWTRRARYLWIRRDELRRGNGRAAQAAIW